jgi:hypothetical protein
LKRAISGSAVVAARAAALKATNAEFARRRRQLARLMGRNSIAIIPAAPVRHQGDPTDDTAPWREAGATWWLTRFKHTAGADEVRAVIDAGPAPV